MQLFPGKTDHLVFFKNSPKRIISLVPSQTELLFDLGLDEEITGITKFCVHPPVWFDTKTKIGGTKKIHLDIIHQLKPDLIIANKEENVKEQVEELAKDYPVWVTDVNDLISAYEMIEQMGFLTGKAEKAIELISTIKQNFTQLPITGEKLLTCYLIWNNPYMTVGGDTFIHSMMETAGFENIFKQKQRYPIVTIEDLRISPCELLLLSSEPFPFKQKHINEMQSALNQVGLTKTKILLVDGEMFSWYGSHLRQAPAYFRELYKLINNRR